MTFLTPQKAKGSPITKAIKGLKSVKSTPTLAKIVVVKSTGRVIIANIFTQQLNFSIRPFYFYFKDCGKSVKTLWKTCGKLIFYKEPFYKTENNNKQNSIGK